MALGCCDLPAEELQAPLPIQWATGLREELWVLLKLAGFLLKWVPGTILGMRCPQAAYHC